jgi:hypothetical protein
MNIPSTTLHAGPARRAVCGTLLLGALLGVPAAGTTPDDEPGARIDGARSVLEKWVETRRVISKEKRDWSLGREILGERIALVRREIDSLRARIDEAGASIAETDRKAAELVDENEGLKQASAALVGIVRELEERTGALMHWLPEPLRERVKPLSQRLPVDPDDTKLTLSERFMNVVGILNTVTKANREVSVSSEVHTLPDGTRAEVTALYLGIGQAWYVSANGTVAGTGRATAEGWSWTPADAASPQIARAIRILNGEEVASFVRVPIRLGKEGE